MAAVVVSELGHAKQRQKVEPQILQVQSVYRSQDALILRQRQLPWVHQVHGKCLSPSAAFEFGVL